MSKILNIVDENTANEVVETIKNGGVSLLPTDTAYALCVDANNREAVEKIFKIKGRDVNKKLPIFFDTVNRINREVVISEKAQRLIKIFWPGALTLISPINRISYKNLWPSSIISEGKIGIRIPDSEFIRDVVRKLGRPITATSANRSGKDTCYSIEEVRHSLGPNFDMIDVVVDHGVLAKNTVSTIVKVVGDEVEIIREGAISREEIGKVLN